MGVFSVVQKSLLHHSNIYSGAPMPYMQRITWSGVAMHEGGNLGHPASHGCIRMSHDFATRLWVLTRLGARVVIARTELRPEDFSDPHLFVHKQPTPAPDPAASAEPTIKALRTALSADDDGKATDAPGQLKEEVKATAGMSADLDAADPLPAANADKSAERSIAPAVREAMKMATASDNALAEPITAAPPVPVPKPTEIAHASKTPISVFVSGKGEKDLRAAGFFALVQRADHYRASGAAPGTHVFTAMEYLADRSSFRWNVISLPGEPVAPRNAEPGKKAALAKRGNARAAKQPDDPPPPPPQTPQQALARIGIPQDTLDRISQLFIPVFFDRFRSGPRRGNRRRNRLYRRHPQRGGPRRSRRGSQAAALLPLSRGSAYWPEPYLR